MKTELNKTNNEVSELKSLPDSFYENIFNVYKDGDFFAYNILKTIKIPDNLDTRLYDSVIVSGKISWQKLSFDQYNTINLWWLICLTNGIKNPTYLPEPGTFLKIIKPEYLNDVLDEIEAQLNNS